MELPPSLKRRRFLKPVRDVILSGPDPDAALFSSRPFYSLSLGVHSYLPSPAKSDLGTRFLNVFLRRVDKVFEGNPLRDGIVEAFLDVPREVDLI